MVFLSNLNKFYDKNQHNYTSNSLRIYILELLLHKTIIIIIFMDLLIIIHSSNFDYFLSVNRFLYKRDKTRYVESLYAIVSLK